MIVDFREPTEFSWNALQHPDKSSHCLTDTLCTDDGTEPELKWDGDCFFDHKKNQVNSKYAPSGKLWNYLKGYKEKPEAKGNRI